MNCFEHIQKPAVGNCTYCGRGLCRDCATVVDGKLSCRGACQEQITRERKLLVKSEESIQQRSDIYETSSGVYQRSFAAMAIFGLAFVATGVFLIVNQDTIIGAGMLVLGTVFLVNGYGHARTGKKFKKFAAQGREQGSKT